MNDRFRFRLWDADLQTYFFSNNDGSLQFDIEKVLDGLNITDGDVLEQCTGLKDKNGRLIYEGDILDFDLSIPKNGGNYRGIVYWQNQNNLIGWMISSLKHTGSWDIRQIAHPNDWMTWAKVIGNIHENPELLEDK